MLGPINLYWVVISYPDPAGELVAKTVGELHRVVDLLLGGGVAVLDDRDTIANKGDDVLVNFESSDGLPDENVGDAVFGQGHQVWFATVGDGVALLDYGNGLGNKADDRAGGAYAGGDDTSKSDTSKSGSSGGDGADASVAGARRSPSRSETFLPRR